jgi:hypothetical protein
MLGDDKILEVTSSPMNKHLVTRVEFMPHSRQSLSPGPSQTEPDPTKAIHTYAPLLQESGDRDDVKEDTDAEQPSPKPPPSSPTDYEQDYARPITTGKLFDHKQPSPNAVLTKQGVKPLPGPATQPTHVDSPGELVEKRGLNGLEDMQKQMEYFPPLPY